MLKLTPVSSALAALMIASVLSGCGGGNVEAVSAPVGGAAQTATASAAAETAKAAEDAAAAKAAKAAEAEAAKVAADATAAKVAAAADAAAAAKAKAAAAAKIKAAAAAAVVVQPAAAPKPAPAPAPSAKKYANCTAMHVDYKGGVARLGAVDQRASGHAQYAPVYSTLLYEANSGSDRDKDGIACEA